MPSGSAKSDDGRNIINTFSIIYFLTKYNISIEFSTNSFYYRPLTRRLCTVMRRKG